MSDTRKPNIVMMVADNTGYGDLGCYGGGELRGAPTPNLDRMAAEGLRMTSFYTETQCTPTRAALMTGRLPVRDGMTVALVPGAGGGMSESEITLAEILSDAGYETALFGKWHLGDSDSNLPQMKGFDEFWGFLYHVDAGIAENTLVIWFSDNGPTNYSWPDSGFMPFRGEVGTGLEGGVRCPAIFWWPGVIEPGRVSNEIMASLDFYNTLAALGGASIPSDRPIDGVDQSDFLRGEQARSNREHVMTFVGRDLVSMRWRQFKVHFKVKENMMGSVLNNQFPFMYNIEMDPREEHDIAGQNLWLLEVSGRYVKELERSFQAFPNREPQS